MATMRSAIKQESGIPLGGLGTGSVEIRSDGYFHEWQIFNLGAWASRQPKEVQGKVPDMPPSALSFFVRTREEGHPPLMRRLGLRCDQHNLYSFSWLKSVREIEFTGACPVAFLNYGDETLPVTVDAVVFSPFVPHDARTSATPGFNAVFRVANRSRASVEVSILGVLKNPLAWGAEDRRLVNRVTRQGDTAHLSMRTDARTDFQATVGSLCLSVTGGEPSWICGDYPGHLSGYFIGHWGGTPVPYGMPHECFLHDYRETGRLPSLSGNRSPSHLLPLNAEEVARLSPADQDRILEALKQHPFARAMWERVKKVAPAALRSREDRMRFLNVMRVRLDHLGGLDRKAQQWGDGALSSAVTLAPGETKEVRFAVAWHFPFHYSATGSVLGHMYENWFKDAEDVARFLTANFESHRRLTVGFADTLFHTSLAPELADAWAGQLTTIPKCTWWTRDGEFGVWEGLGCCGFHTTDITYQGSFNLLAIFPDLQKRQMKMGARFQRSDGRVHHYFTPDFSAVDDGFDRVDMNHQFVLLVCRDYLWTGDTQYLRSLWPNIVRAMNAMEEIDKDGDGLPDHDTRRNTYDAWDFCGTPAYIASLWLAALRAAIRLAEDLRQGRRAARWRRILRRGTASFEKKLWNGEYYSLWVDGKTRDECCMSDQIDGEWFAQVIGIGHALPSERIRAAMQAVMRHNFSEEAGLINATYPPGKKPRLSTWQNLQAMAPWTGIEYAMASLMMEFGMAADGLAVVRNIHDRYLEAGRFWNHVECGDHYYRAMSSWALLLSATGFKVDAPRRSVTFAPAFEAPEVVAPWVSATAWGSFRLAPNRFHLTCTDGALAFRNLRLKLAGKSCAAQCNDRAVPLARPRRQENLIEIPFRREVVVRPGDRFTVTAG